MLRKILFLVFAFLPYAGKTLAQAKIFFENKNYDFGEVIEGEKVSTDFVFKNTGDQPLVISSVRPSCGCTTPFWTKEAVAPGETGVIKAMYNSKNRPGKFRKSIVVQSNASDGAVNLFISGTVIKEGAGRREPSSKELAVSPKVVIAEKAIKVGQVQVGTVNSIELRVENHGPSPLKIDGVRSGCNCVGLMEKIEPIRNNENAVVRLTYEPKNIGLKSEKLTLITNDLRKPKTQIVLEAEVLESLEDHNLLREKKSIF